MIALQSVNLSAELMAAREATARDAAKLRPFKRGHDGAGWR
jgi:hypothetical protein